MAFNTTLTYTMPVLADMDIMATIKDELYSDTDRLADVELIMVYNRTHVWTGALRSGITASAAHDVNDPLLVWLTAEDDPQLAMWGRVYVQYQEGGALGLPTYTNPPRLMFASVGTDDLPILAAWAYENCERALTRCTDGTGIPL
jgi:hypothetical protein